MTEQQRMDILRRADDLVASWKRLAKRKRLAPSGLSEGEARALALNAGYAALPFECCPAELIQLIRWAEGVKATQRMLDSVVRGDYAIRWRWDREEAEMSPMPVVDGSYGEEIRDVIALGASSGDFRGIDRLGGQ